MNMKFGVIFSLTFGIFSVVLSINLTSLKKYKILFDPQCQEYFLFNGTDDYAYFHRKNEKFELWLTQNSSNYAVYTTKSTSTLMFGWNDTVVSINQQQMDLVLSEGTIQYPMTFQSEFYLCDIQGIVAGDVDYLCLEEQMTCDLETLSYKCEPQSNLILICTVALSVVTIILLILYAKYESLKALLGSTLPWFIQWCRQILSGSEESSTECDEEEYSTITSESGSIQFA